MISILHKQPNIVDKDICDLITKCYNPTIEIEESDSYKIVKALKDEHAKIYKQILSVITNVSEDTNAS